MTSGKCFSPNFMIFKREMFIGTACRCLLRPPLFLWFYKVYFETVCARCREKLCCSGQWLHCVHIKWWN